MAKKGGIIAGSIKYQRIVHLLVALVVVFGVYALAKMNKDEFPAFTIRQGIVVGVFPGATVEEVQEQLTQPLEQLLFSMPEVNRKNTYSVTKAGMAYVYVDLDLSVEDKDAAWSKIRHRLNEAKRLQFPVGVVALLVVDDFGNNSSMLLALETGDKTYRELHPYVQQLKSRLQAIPTMGNVRVLGERKEEIAVEMSREKMALYGLSPQNIYLSYATQNLLTVNPTYAVGQFDYPIHVASSMVSEYDVAEHIVGATPDGQSVRVKDLAQVQRRYASSNKMVQYNASDAIVISVEMRKGNNILSFGEEVEVVLNDFSKTLPASVRVHKITDQPKVVSQSINSFVRDLVISMLVVIAVMLLLFPLRTALVASSSLPICTAAAIALMYLFNIELNTVTLAALIVVLGMIVDDSIINIDGYIDKLQKGLTPMEAAVSGARELFMPMFIATMAISMMFFPIKTIITGPLGDFIQLFPWTILFALASSLVYAMLVIPALEVRFIVWGKGMRETRFERYQRRFFVWLQARYDALQRVCFAHPKLTITVGVGSILLGIVMFLQLNVQMMPMAERDSFAIELRLPEGSSVEETKSVCDSLQRMLLREDGVQSVTAFVGEPAPRFHITYSPSMPANNLAQLIVNTSSIATTERLLPVLDAKYTDYFKNARVRIRQLDYQAATNPIEVFVLGDDRDSLRKVAIPIKHYMQRELAGELRGVFADCDESQSTLRVELNADECVRLGVNKAMLSASLASSLSGVQVATITEHGQDVGVNLYLTDSREGALNEVENILIPTAIPTVWVPLRQVARVVPHWEPAKLVRRQGHECITVGADMRFWQPQTRSMRRLRSFIENELDIPEGVSIAYGGLDSLNASVVPQILKSFIVAVFILFAFMVMYFKKLDIAALTIAASLLCLFGAFFGEWLFGLDFGMTSVLGVVSLIGIIVRNGIIMYEYAEELRLQRGMSAREAAREAGSRRMRPIFLTSATTALGVIPMVLSRNPLWMPMGVVICFGVVLSLVIVLSVMPVTYWKIYSKQSPDVVGSKNEE